MKKSNYITTIFLCFMIFFAMISILFFNMNRTAKMQEKADKTIEKTEQTEQEKEGKKKLERNEDLKTDQLHQENASLITMEHTLFIGDSRTVGLMEYSQIQGADYFCTVGMSVFNIHDNAVSVPNVGKVTLIELLEQKNYDKIYIMLGVNEVGYRLEKIITEYENLIQEIKEKEKGVTVFLQANLHVTNARSVSDAVVNNQAINRLNQKLSTLANKKDVFYLNVNPLFDDENGDLSSDLSSDHTHLYAKYYEVWGKWIIEKTTLLMKEG